MNTDYFVIDYGLKRLFQLIFVKGPCITSNFLWRLIFEESYQLHFSKAFVSGVCQKNITDLVFQQNTVSEKLCFRN